MEPGRGKPCHYARIADNLLATSVVVTLTVAQANHPLQKSYAHLSHVTIVDRLCLFDVRYGSL